MTFDLFVLPFILGLIALLIWLTTHFIGWLRSLPNEDIIKIRNKFLTKETLNALGEVFMESFIHRRMFRKNKLLGFMHMSFAFGWFLLIVVGNIESRVYSGWHINPPYYPIFLKFFVHDIRVLPFEIFTIPGFFRFTMDILLLLVLSGLVLALIKRTRSKWFGLKKTTKHTFFDRIAIKSLWLIFPLRLLAESFTAGYWQTGSFLTNSLGNVFASFLPVEVMAYPFWWMYSFALGVFFVTLPFSRYMHIPAEILLIFLRHYGISVNKDNHIMEEINVNSCPRCGVCIDACQLNTEAGVNEIMPVYFLRSVREKETKHDEVFSCAVCGRCQQVCPVGIEVNSIRTVKRLQENNKQAFDFSYLSPVPQAQTEVLYFAGCMTHLTPGIKNAMVNLLNIFGVNYRFLDEDGSVCCGRPLMLAGKDKAAAKLMEYNRQLIQSSGAKILVTSCPICFKIFKEEYNLGIEVLHHSQYLLRLTQEGELQTNPGKLNVVYHDSCELGRGSGIYEEPRQLLASFAHLIAADPEKENGLCCGGSIASIGTSKEQKDKVALGALRQLSLSHPDIIATACPLCKKTFSKLSQVRVADIAEVVYESLLNLTPALETIQEESVLELEEAPCIK